ENPSRETVAEQATARLLNDLITGVFEPGENLRMEKLKQRYSVGASPLREALARLVSLGFVTAESHRGFRAAPLSRADIEDITLVRQSLEATALTRCLELAGDEWEVGLVAALRRLALVCSRPPTEHEERVRAIDRAHWLLHRAIVAACHSPRLLELQERYYQQAWRYRRRSLHLLAASPMDEFVREHEILVQTLLERDPVHAVQALRDHLALTPRDFAVESASGAAHPQIG